MLKIKNKAGKTIMVLEDDASTPESVEEVKFEESEDTVSGVIEGEEDADI